MAENIKLPVHLGTGAFAGIVYDYAGEPVDLADVVATLNAHVRRCDGCKHYPAAPAPGTTVRKFGACAKNSGTAWALHESCSRWAPRDELKGET